MEQYFLIMLVILAFLAVFDLFVGVSNDAVNFLNSAIGCRIASFKTTMAVAALGVLLGATFSSGMMEIARSGVFHPQMFSFTEIMVIFFAVMVADVILLDLFNSFGLPTSTTVSIVFELLGSALATACIKMFIDGAAIADIANYINSSKALAIISGILVSVVVAFICGAIVQYLMRLLFTFNFEKAYRRYGAIFAGFAITAIVYFLLLKGAKGASFMRPEWLSFIKANIGMIVCVLFVILTIISQILISAFRVNIFKIVILSGTFSLAFAFAGNDLVNFVGVPIAALDSYQSWSASGVAADSFMMEGLKKATQTPTYLLLGAGLIMVLTLCFSRKAYRVVQTSINLSSSDSGEQEQFSASAPGRVIVRGAMGFGRILHQVIPAGVFSALNSRFEPRELRTDEVPLAFDYVRASVNLIVSAILIASATSLKLPLSTTYVTFMVAMGSSFADGAWDRESAVYRISGVLTVICGWFLTAACASTMAAIVVSLIYAGGGIGAVLLGLLAIFLLVRSNLRAVREEDSQRKRIEAFDGETVQAFLNEKTRENLCSAVSLFARIVDDCLNEKERDLHRGRELAEDAVDDLTRDRALYYRMSNTLSKVTKADYDARYCYYRSFTNMLSASQAVLELARQSYEHVANQHKSYKGAVRRELAEFASELQKLTSDASGRSDSKAFTMAAPDLIERVDQLQRSLLQSIPKDRISVRGSELYLNILRVARIIVNRYTVATIMQQQLAVPQDQAQG